MKRKAGCRECWHVWRIPIFLAALIVFGLLSALFGTGVWHVLSWAALALPLVVIAWFTGFPQPHKTDEDHSLGVAASGQTVSLPPRRGRRRRL